VSVGAGQTAPSPASSAFNVPYEYFTLPNGLKVVVSPDHTAPVVLVEVMYNIGFRVEPKGRTGFAHLFEHMMFQGSASLKKLEHIQYVSRAGGVLNYYQVVPANALDLTLWLEADRMRALDLTPENLKNQQNVVSEEVRVNVLNQPHAGFEWLDLWEKANTNWHNAHNFYGDLSELEAATLDDVRAFFQTYYVPNAVLVVVGDTTAAEVKALAEKHFGGIARRPLPPPADVTEAAQMAEKRSTRDDRLARTPALAMAWHLPPRLSKDFFALAVLDPLIVGDQSARLHQKLVRETRQATSLAGAFNLLGTNWDMKGPMLFTVRVDYRPDTNADQVIAAVDEVLADVRARDVAAAELASAKRALRSAFFEDLEGGGLPRFGRANLLAAFALFDDDPGRINTILASLDAVTLDEVKAAAGRWFVASNRTTIDSRPAAAPASPGGAR
jgi:predicted Zn-dependent peptidase